MNGKNLEVKLFDNFTLRNPIWVASSHQTADESSLDLWSIYKPAALTLKTSSLASGGDGKNNGSRTYVRLSQRASWFTDGPKNIELISGNRTKELLTFAKETLPETLIGVSILQYEDYGKFKQFTEGSDFVELNTKYSGRLPYEEGLPSYFEVHNKRHQELIEHLTVFSDTFSNIPQFVKLSREFPWIIPCKEFELLSQKLVELHSEGRKIGLIIANTPHLRIPPADLIPKKDEKVKRKKIPTELSGGVLCGEDLFIGTYNFIREIRLSGILPETIPIVASGGILCLEDIVDIFQAGAKAIQMCTAFQENKFQYYAWLNGQLSQLLKHINCNSMRIFCLTIREGSEAEKKVIREAVDFVSKDFKEYVEQEIKQKQSEIFDILASVVKAEASQTNIPDISVNNFEDFLLKPLNLDLPALNYNCTQLSGMLPDFDPNERMRPITLLSMLGSLLGHTLLLLLSKDVWPNSIVLPRYDSMSVLKTMASEHWDLAVVSMANLTKLREINFNYKYKPVLLGIIASGNYVLRSTAQDLDTIKEVYHFGGIQSEECLGKLRESIPALCKHDPTQGTITDLAQLLQIPMESLGIFVKDPIGSIYPKITANKSMKELASIPVYYCLLSSSQCAKSLGSQGLTYIYQKLSSWKNEIKNDPSNAIAILKRDNILEKIITYLEPK